MLPINYCKNDSNKEFEGKVLVELLGNLRRFDLRTKELKPMMAKARRRIVFGGMETRKLIEVEKVKALIIAKNLTDETLLDEDFKFCMAQDEIPKIFCLTRKQLGNALVGESARIGIVGILKLDGVFEVWNQILEELKDLKDSWIERIVTVDNVDNENSDDVHKSIWWSSYYGHLEVLERLKDKNLENFKSQINRGNFEFSGKTPLIVSVERNHVEVVKFLLELGADQDIPDFSLNRPNHLIKTSEMAKLFDFSSLTALKKNSAGFTGIEMAILNENLEVLQVIFEKKSNAIDDQKKFNSYNGNSLLMESVQNNSYEVFKYLVSVSKTTIDFEYMNHNNETIWDICGNNKNIGISRYLEKRKRKEKDLTN